MWKTRKFEKTFPARENQYFSKIVSQAEFLSRKLMENMDKKAKKKSVEKII